MVETILTSIFLYDESNFLNDKNNITIDINLQIFKINNKQFKKNLDINFSWDNKPNCSNMIYACHALFGWEELHHHLIACQNKNNGKKEMRQNLQTQLLYTYIC
jgi:hypothetical protein